MIRRQFGLLMDQVDTESVTLSKLQSQDARCWHRPGPRWPLPSSPRSPTCCSFSPTRSGCARLGYNGGKNTPTPNIDRFASQGMQFRNALSTGPLCTPYRAMLQTGRWPTLSGGADELGQPAVSGAIDWRGVCARWHDTATSASGTWRRGARAGSLKRGEATTTKPGRSSCRLVRGA